MYEADERGFNNPKGAWSRMGIDVAAVGDSFTQRASAFRRIARSWAEFDRSLPFHSQRG